MKRNNMKKRLCMALRALFSVQSKDELTELEKKIEKGPVPLTEFYDEISRFYDFF